MGKSYVLDSIITALKQQYSYDDDKYLIIVLTGKAVSNIYSSIIHSHKEGLSIPTRGKLTELKGKRLDYFQKKYKNLKLVIMDEFTIISKKCYIILTNVLGKLQPLMNHSVV